MGKPDAWIAKVEGIAVQSGVHRNEAWDERNWEVVPCYAIDDETREALREAIANFREDMADLHPQSSLLPMYSKYVAALERLRGE